MKLILEHWREFLKEDYDLQNHPKKEWIRQDLSTIDEEIMEYLFEQYKTVYSAEGLDLSGQSGLVGYWKFDEGSGTTVTDYSGNGNHGTFAAISGDTTAQPTWGKR